ncbi:MAG: DsbA family oxidoreductase [Pseudomonadota bacterium]
MQIEIFSDVVCPWCFIGKRRLDKTLQAADLQETDISLRWRPYQLHANLPDAGVDRLDYLQQRYGPDADPGRIPERIRAEAEDEGIELRFDLIKRTPNTLLAHRLLEFAVPHDKQHELAEALFIAYFCQGKDVGKRDVLVEVAAGVGLDSAAAAEFLSSDAGTAEVQQQLARAPELGVSGVPGYYIANAFLLPGAQTSEVMGQIINRVRERIESGAIAN